MIPGTTNLPVTSITVAPAGAVTPVPMSRSLPFSITIVTLLWGAAPLPSIRVAPRSTVTCAAAPRALSAAAANTRNANLRMVAPMLAAVLQLPCSAGRSMASSGSSGALSLAHHGRDQMFDRRRAHLLGHGAGADAQDLEHALDAGLAEGAEPPEIGPAHADRLGAHAQRLDHIGAAAEAGVDQNRHRARDLYDLRQCLDRRASPVI